MRRRHSTAQVLALIVAATSAGCPGLLDFSAPLTGGYFLHRTSSIDIFVASEKSWDSSTQEIPPTIIELTYDENWIIAKQLPVDLAGEMNKAQEPFPFSKANVNAINYWILNVKVPRVWGPLSEDVFRSQRLKLGVSPQLELKNLCDTFLKCYTD